MRAKNVQEKTVVTVLRPRQRLLKSRDLEEAAFLLGKISTMMLININNLLTEYTDLSTLNMDASNTLLYPEPPNSSALNVQTAHIPSTEVSPSLSNQNSITT